MFKTKMIMYPDWGPRVIRGQSFGAPGFLYTDYAHKVGQEILDAALLVFDLHNKPGNETRISEFSPPRYRNSFKLKYYRTTGSLRVVNDDPGWFLVEFGAHPGGDEATFVLRYKPLTRGLIIVGRKHNG